MLNIKSMKIRDRKTLIALNLHENNINASGPQSLTDELEINIPLLTLDIGDNRIAIQGAQYLANALQINSTLTKLDLQENNIGNLSMRDLANALTTLNLRACCIQNDEIQDLINILVR
ncbi:hypothetical protein I4U23_000936 [Adineta vaga]|nr:hypothetical protein I4U23_000936 [Adineta vaga]